MGLYGFSDDLRKPSFSIRCWFFGISSQLRSPPTHRVAKLLVSGMLKARALCLGLKPLCDLDFASNESHQSSSSEASCQSGNNFAYSNASLNSPSSNVSFLSFKVIPTHTPSLPVSYNNICQPFDAIMYCASLIMPSRSNSIVSLSAPSGSPT